MDPRSFVRPVRARARTAAPRRTRTGGPAAPRDALAFACSLASVAGRGRAAVGPAIVGAHRHRHRHRQISRGARRLVAPLPACRALSESAHALTPAPAGRGAHPGCPARPLCRAVGVKGHGQCFVSWGCRPIFSCQFLFNPQEQQASPIFLRNRSPSSAGVVRCP